MFCTSKRSIDKKLEQSIDRVFLRDSIFRFFWSIILRGRVFLVMPNRNLVGLGFMSQGNFKITSAAVVVQTYKIMNIQPNMPNMPVIILTGASRGWYE